MVDQSSKVLYVRFSDTRSSPLQSKSLQFNSQRIELADFVDIQGRYESSLILDTAHESLMLEANKSLAYCRRSHVHLPGDLALDDHRSRLQHTREKGIL